MADSEIPRVKRASLRGKGRAILTGDDTDQPLKVDDTPARSDESAPFVPPQEFAADRPLFEAPGPSIGTIQPLNDIEDAPDAKDPREGGLIHQPQPRPTSEPVGDPFGTGPLVQVGTFPEAVGDPFGGGTSRTQSLVLFGEPPPPDSDPDLLVQLVPDENIAQLWAQIEALHEEIIREVRGDRGETDMYLKDLHDASALLLAKRENYDEARAIVIRIRADLNRRRKVEKDIAVHRPRLLKYYLWWGVAWVVIALTGQTLIERSGLFPASGVPIVFYPVLFGVLGALVSGFLTLERHTTHLRDFDPLHVSWYLFNPPLGAVMGLLMLLLYAIVNQDVLQPGAAEPMELAVVWLLCALAGMNQHAVLRHIYRLLDRLASGGK